MEHNEINSKNDQQLADFEVQLQQALRHRAAPLGLKQRVLAEARARRQGRHGRLWMLQRVAASVVVAALFAGVAAYRETEQRRKGEQAREQVLTAMRITSRTLNHVNQHLADDER